MSDNPPSRDQSKFIIRFPEGMRERIAEAAKMNNRSMNAEIVARLGDSFILSPEKFSEEEFNKRKKLYTAGAMSAVGFAFRTLIQNKSYTDEDKLSLVLKLSSGLEDQAEREKLALTADKE